ncbi:hypothetical protein BDZ91DRAFT_711410 [Kalaharituber pfeilii]|nr:hypothetical protein BDZ91DRAFT_711410 [Kalaharituber pfeilii]
MPPKKDKRKQNGAAQALSHPGQEDRGILQLEALTIGDSPQSQAARLKSQIAEGLARTKHKMNKEKTTKKPKVADSWEDGISSGGEEEGAEEVPAQTTADMCDRIPPAGSGAANPKSKSDADIDADTGGGGDSWEDQVSDVEEGEVPPTKWKSTANIAPTTDNTTSISISTTARAAYQTSSRPPSSSSPSSIVPPPFLSSWDQTPEPTPITSDSAPKRRQPTTDAVARRLISAALGVRAPRATKEQKEYEASIKEQLRKRQEKERQERAERERAEQEVERRKREIWGD